jgi:hypothetical protein
MTDEEVSKRIMELASEIEETHLGPSIILGTVACMLMGFEESSLAPLVHLAGTMSTAALSVMEKDI